MAATLGQLIRERREALDLTQEQLAELVGDGVRQSEISRLERNRVALPRRQRMEQLAAALDIPVGVLLARSGWVGAEEIQAGDQAHGVDATTVAANQPPGPDSGPFAAPEEDSGEQFLERDWRDHDDSWHVSAPHDQGARKRDAYLETNEDAQSFRDTMTRNESLIELTRSRLDDVHATIESGRRSIRRAQPADLS